jgi:hypothetical protein
MTRQDEVTDILHRLHDLGVEVKADGDDLLLAPGSRVPIDLVAAIRGSKADVLSRLVEGTGEVPRSLRVRVNISVSVKGVVTWDATCDGQGYTRDEVLAESDALVAELQARYPITVT